MAQTTHSSGEDRLIARYFAAARDRIPARFGAAPTTPRSSSRRRAATSCSTTDAIVGGVHFFADDPPDAVARKALRVNLSDLAAKGATPLGFLLSLALPRRLPTTGSPLSRTAWARMPRIRLPAARRRYRSHAGAADHFDHRVRHRAARHHGAPRGAKPGDRVVVTGTIGDAALGLVSSDAARRALGTRRCAARASAVGRYLLPQPRTALAEARARITPARRWTCRTALPAISPSSATPPASPPPSMPQAFRCRQRRAACWRAGIVGVEAIVPAATITRSCARYRRGWLLKHSPRPLSRGVAMTAIGTIVAGPSFRVARNRARRSRCRGSPTAILRTRVDARISGICGFRTAAWPPVPSARNAQVNANTCSNITDPLQPGTALRRGNDFGMVPPI